MRNIRRWGRLLMLCLAIGSLSAAAQKTYAWLTDTSTGSPLQVEAASYTTGNVIVLDAGHGGYDTGSISYDGVYEKDITLAITQKIGEQLEKAGYTVVYTRTSDEVIWSNDNRDDLRTRVAIGEEAGADYYISIQQPCACHAAGAWLHHRQCGCSLYVQRGRTECTRSKHCTGNPGTALAFAPFLGYN